MKRQKIKKNSNENNHSHPLHRLISFLVGINIIGCVSMSKRPYMEEWRVNVT